MNTGPAIRISKHDLPRILVVDDNNVNLATITTFLKIHYKVISAENGEEALRLIHMDEPPEVVLLDVMMPGMDGFEVCTRLKRDDKTKDIPVIFLSGLHDTKEKVKGLELGAVDFISKPFQKEEVIARVSTHLNLSRLKGELAEKNKALKSANMFLERRVQKRTAELIALNKAFERFVPREFLSHLKKNSILEIEPGDQIKKQMTVMFADIRGWTALSEQMTPQENFNFINAYLKNVTPAIKKNDGFIDQYYGDGIMALFPNLPDNALKAALDMRASVKAYNQCREDNGLDPIEIGIGIHVGDMMLGIIGSNDRLQGAVVSDDVNLAARLEDLTRTYGSFITLSDEILTNLRSPGDFLFRFIDKVLVKGKKQPVSVFELFSGDPPDIAEKKVLTKTDFETGIVLYYNKKFSEASVQFSKVLTHNASDKAARIYLERCAHYMVRTLPDDWSGVNNLPDF